MSRRALLVGIDGYPLRPLSTCCNDARALAPLIAFDHDSTSNWATTVRVARDPEATVVTREDLLNDLADLLSSPADDVLFYFSGHAVTTPWGPELATQEGLLPGDGVSFSNLMTLVNTSPATSITVILDCCYSGDLGTEHPGDGFVLGRQDRTLLRENVVILASTRADGESVGAGELSTFTALLVDGLKGGASNRRGQVTALSVYSHAWSAMANGHAKPQLKANCATLPVLRCCKPWASPESFRALPALFPADDGEVLVDAAWLAEDHPNHPLWLTIADLHAARLVESDDGRSLEWSARVGRPVRLTHIGRYYRRVVSGEGPAAFAAPG